MASYHYFGNEGETVPEDVEVLVVHPLVQEIPEKFCFRNGWLTQVNFRGSALTTIGENAFYECSNLLEVEIAPSVTTIGANAFLECHSLAHVRFHEDGLLTSIGAAAFAYCRSLTEISIPSKVEIIPPYAFFDCQRLAKVFFQEGLKIIERSAFADCVSLIKVDIPRTLEMMGSRAFRYCALLQEVNLEEGHLRVIGTEAFRKCVKLLTFSIPSTVERVKVETFRECHSLGVMKFKNGLKHVSDRAFYSCNNLQAISLPESVEVIGERAFGDCHDLVSVEMGDSPTGLTIHDDAFADCTSFVNICLPPSDSGTAISSPDSRRHSVVGINSFRFCSKLEKQYGHSNIPLALIHRFDHYPIHKKCYYASVTTVDELARELDPLMQSSLDIVTNHFVDPFGMTPFHVLLSSANCRVDLLHVLLDAYQPHLLGLKDVNDKTAIDYLAQRMYLAGDPRKMLRMALERWMVDFVSSWKGLESWHLDMSSRVNAIVAEEEVDQRRSLLEEAAIVLSRYQQIEATTSLELSLWKTELSKSANGASRTIVDKEACRIRCGASVVIPNVSAFLYETIHKEDDYSDEDISEDYILYP